MISINFYRSSCLVFSIIISLVISYKALNTTVPYYDYDSSTVAIFVNNIKENRKHNYFFSTSNENQDKYRAAWSSQWLPLTSFISFISNTFKISSQNTLYLLKLFGLLFSILGTFSLVFFFKKILEHSFFESIMGACFILTAPTFFLYTQTTIANIMLYWFLTWLNFLLICYFIKYNNKYLYILSIPTSFLLLMPYPFVFVFPIFTIFYLFTKESLLKLLKNTHSYLAVALTFLIATILCYLAIYSNNTTIHSYLDDLGYFYSLRKNTNNLGLYDTFITQIEILYQTFITLKSNSIDSRSENMWVLGSFHYTWNIILCLSFFGLITLFKNLELVERKKIILTFIFAHIIIFTFIFNITSRYLLLLTPIIISLLLTGTKSIIKNKFLHCTFLTVLCISTSLITYHISSTTYKKNMINRWKEFDGIEDSIAYLIENKINNDPILFNPGNSNYGTQLLIMALADFKIYSVRYKPMLEHLNNHASVNINSLDNYTLIPYNAIKKFKKLNKNGWFKYSNIVDRYSKNKFIILKKH